MRVRFLLALAASAVALSGCGGGIAPVETIMIDGSSTVFPPTQAVAKAFQSAETGKVRVTVGVSGTGGGFKKFCRGETDVHNASRPIMTEELAACRDARVRFYELPIAFDALTVAVNPQNDWAQCLTVAELKALWEPAAQAKVTQWNQMRAGFPDAKITLFGAGPDSGTFDYFTEAVVEKVKASRADYTGSEDDNVLVRGIENDRNALGYIPYAYFAPHSDKLKAVAIDSGKGCVLPTLENVTNGSYAPLSRPLFIYVNAKSAEKPMVKRFVEFYLQNGGALVEQVKYLPLPKSAYQATAARFQSAKIGTAFGGIPEVGLHVDEILKREPKS